MLLPNGIRTSYAYNSLTDRLTSVTHVKESTSTTISSYTYTHRADGRRSGVTEVYDGTTTLITYAYDALNRLTGETRKVGAGSPQTTTYTYDLVGNRVKKHDGAYETTYAYNDRDQLTLEDSTHSDPLKEIAYTYDDNGSLIAKDYANDTVVEDTFTYSVEQRLTAAAIKRVEQVSSVDHTVWIESAYRYNHQGIRVQADQTLFESQETGQSVVQHTPASRRYLVDSYNHTGYAQVLEEQDDSYDVTMTYTIGEAALTPSLSQRERESFKSPICALHFSL